MKFESTILNLNDPIEMTILACLVLTLAYFFLKSGGHENVRKPESGEKNEGLPRPPAPPAPPPAAVLQEPVAPPQPAAVVPVQPMTAPPHQPLVVPPQPVPQPQPAAPPRFVAPELPAGTGNAMRAYLAILDQMASEPPRLKGQSASDLWAF